MKHVGCTHASLTLGICLVLLEEVKRPQNHNLEILRFSIKKHGLISSPKKHLTEASPSQWWETEGYCFNCLNLSKCFLTAFIKQLL